jgi:hypothetical protein
MKVIDLTDRTTANLTQLLENAKISNLPQEEKDELILKIEAKLEIGHNFKEILKDIQDGLADIDDMKT